MRRVLLPEGKLVLIKMSKRDEWMTFFERIYRRGWPVGPCRPVLMAPYLEQAGFTDVQRTYRPTDGSLVAVLWGQEIVLARKATA